MGRSLAIYTFYRSSAIEAEPHDHGVGSGHSPIPRKVLRMIPGRRFPLILEIFVRLFL